ncbi:MAG: PEP-CTERM sorting domain-containing protein [Phycisphaerae bacterium]
MLREQQPNKNIQRKSVPLALRGIACRRFMTAAFAVLAITGTWGAAVAPARAGMINALFTPGTPGVDLTAQGTVDWAVLGVTAGGGEGMDPAIPSARKASVASVDQITIAINDSGDFATVLGTDNIGSTFSWTDGTPPSSADTQTAGIRVTDDLDFSGMFTVQAPAASANQTLVVYVSADNAIGRLRASLSDGITTSTVENIINFGSEQFGSYTVDFSAAAPNTTLTVTWEHLFGTPSLLPDSSIALYAVTLAPEPSTLACLMAGGCCLLFRRRR